jgi:hypothetical protein
MGICASKRAADASVPGPVPVPAPVPAAAPTSAAAPVPAASLAPAPAAHPPGVPLDAPPDLLQHLNLHEIEGPLRDRLLAALAHPAPAVVVPHASAADLGAPAGSPAAQSSGAALFHAHLHARSAEAAGSSRDGSSRDGSSGGGSAAASASGTGLAWTDRARVLFRAVDAAGAGSVGADECAALVREVLMGAVGVGDGARGAALADFLRELADEGPSVHASAVAAEAEAMMAHATGAPPRLFFDGFVAWLREFMDGLVEEDADAPAGGLRLNEPPPAAINSDADTASGTGAARGGT